MFRGLQFILAVLWMVLVLAVTARAGLQPLSDDELDAGPVGGTNGARPQANGPSEPAVVPLALPGGRVTKTVRSFKELRQQGVVLQALDYSCGAAALSTVMTFYLNKPVKEDAVVGTILVSGQTPQEGIRKYFRRRGFTLLDLKRAATAEGFRGVGYRGMTLEDLVETIEKERVPVLVPINPLGYYHFVVVRGLQGDRVFLADPALGNRTMRTTVFESFWVDGIGFVVSRPNGSASRTGALLASADGSGLTAAAAAASKNGRDDEVSPVLGLRPTEPVPNDLQIDRFMDRTVPPLQPVVTDQMFYNPNGTRVTTIFNLPRYSPGVQFGRPSGNFVDFTPPEGQSIHLNP